MPDLTSTADLGAQYRLIVDPAAVLAGPNFVWGVKPNTGDSINGGALNAVFTVNPLIATTAVNPSHVDCLAVWYAGGQGEWQCRTFTDAVRQNILNDVTSTATEINTLNTVVPGVTQAGHAVVLGADSQVDNLQFAGVAMTASVSGSAAIAANTVSKAITIVTASIGMMSFIYQPSLLQRLGFNIAWWLPLASLCSSTGPLSQLRMISSMHNSVANTPFSVNPAGSNGANRYVDCLAVSYDSVGNTGRWQCQVFSSTVRQNILNDVTSDAAELNLLDGSVAGTAVASKAAVLGANRDIDYLQYTPDATIVAATAPPTVTKSLSTVTFTGTAPFRVTLPVIVATGNHYRFTTAGGNEWSLLPYTAATDTINGGGVGAEWRVDATTRFISCVAVSMTAWSCSASPLNPAANQVGVYTTIPNASATGNPPTTVWNALTVTATASAPNYDYVQLPPAVQGQQYFFLISPTNTNLWTIHPASGGRVNKAGVDVPLFVPLSSTFVHCVAIVSAPGGHWSCEGVEEDTIYTELQQWSFVNKATTADPGTPITTSLTLLNVIAATSFVRLPALIVGAEYRIVVDTVQLLVLGLFRLHLSMVRLMVSLLRLLFQPV